MGCKLFARDFRIKSMERKWSPIVIYHPGIRIDSIPVDGIPGLLFVIATMFMFLGAIPAMREFFLVTGSAGVAWAGILYYWHNQTRW